MVGIPDYLGNWIQGYLKGRSFQVRVGNSLSVIKPIEAGVPQGSVLGPVLFNLFFNDVTKDSPLGVDLGLFADDLSAWTCDKNTRRINMRLQAQLNVIRSWMNTWRTSLSVSKTVWTVFSRGGHCRADTLNLLYNNKVISMDRNPKFLGVTLDPGLRFHEYAKILKTKCTRRLNMLRRIRGQDWGTSSKLLMTSYKVLIRPIIDYVPFVTLTMAATNYMILERVQRRAARAITFWPIHTATSAIYSLLDLDDIHTRALKLTDKYMRKAMKTNEIIKECVTNYNKAPHTYEGSNCAKASRKTILGILKTYDYLDCYELLFPNLPSIQ